MLKHQLKLTHMRSIKIAQFSRTPTLLFIYVQNSYTPWTWTSNFKRIPPPSSPSSQFQTKVFAALYSTLFIHRACEQTKSKQKRNQARHIHIDLTFYCLIYKQCNGIIKRWLHFWRQAQKEDSCQLMFPLAEQGLGIIKARFTAWLKSVL